MLGIGIGCYGEWEVDCNRMEVVVGCDDCCFVVGAHRDDQNDS